MADQLPTSTYYQNLGGINQKVSSYEMSTAQFLNLYNLDFDIPNSLQKRPGSSLFSASGISGAVCSLFEFKTTTSDFIMAASDQALWYASPQVAGGNAFTLISSGLTNTTQPPDMLNYNQVLYAANGAYFERWDGSSLFPAGLPVSPVAGLTNSRQFSLASGVSTYLVAGVTANILTTSPVFQTVDFAAAYSYVRYDGYEGPLNVITQANNLMASVGAFGAQSNGADLLTPAGLGGAGGFLIQGFTVPSGRGITAIAVYLDLHVNNSLVTAQNGDGYIGGSLLKLLPVANTNFKFFTLLPTSTTTFTLTTNEIPSWSGFLATNPRGQSGMTFDWYSTYTPKYIEINQNQLFASGFKSNVNRVWFSNLGSPEFFDPEDFIDIITNDGDQVTAMKYFNEQIVLFKLRSFHKVIGTDPTNFQLLQISSDYGCLSKRAIVTTDLHMLWLDRKGIVQYDGANFKIISTPVEGIFRRMNISAAQEFATAVHWVYRNQIWFGIPIDGSTTNNITVVYDYSVGAWTFFDGFNPASFTYALGNLSVPSVWRGDYTGNVHVFGSSYYNDSGQGITCLAMTRFENDGGENQTTLWRRLFLDVATTSGITGVINGQVFSNYDKGTVQGTFTVYQNQFQTRTEMGILGKSVAAQVSHNSASLPLVINGYGWAKRGLRNV